jgi:serine phosphatase RsbU (regulator of sigma subunit)
MSRTWEVALVGVLATAAAGFLVAYDTHVGAPGIRIGLVAAGTLLAMAISRDRFTRSVRLAHVQSVAEAAQRAVLPELPEREGPAVVAGWYVSATTEALIGGDFYDVVGYRHCARWIIGDVKGKGIGAIRTTAAVLGAFREAAGRVVSLSEVAARIEERVTALTGAEDFVTGLIGELGPDGRVQLVNCGHPSPLRIAANGVVPLNTERRAVPFGLNPEFVSESFTLDPGESLWCFTDGLAEAHTAAGRCVDLEKLGADLAGTSAAATSLAIRERLAADLVNSRFEDDTAVLIIQYDPQPIHEPSAKAPGALDPRLSGLNLEPNADVTAGEEVVRFMLRSGCSAEAK